MRLYKQSNYYDGHHLNLYGAKEFSEILSKCIRGELPEEAYYKSVDEKLGRIPPNYYGIAYRDDLENGMRTIRLVSNRLNYFENKVELLSHDGGTETLQDYSYNNEIVFPIGELLDNNSVFGKKIVVTCRGNNSSER